jgi:hypothetical protein
MTRESKSPPKLNLETADLRAGLKRAFATIYPGTDRAVGSFSCGVYAFFDYDGEPIYVGQTVEGLSSRIGRHLTNQRTDAVAMSVLDPFEVCFVEFYPLAQFNGVKSSHGNFKEARAELNRVELEVFNRCIDNSEFRSILNEKDPTIVPQTGVLPEPLRVKIVSDRVFEMRGHNDIRIARRAQTISRLAQVISERQVNIGLRRTLLIQAVRLEALAKRQFEAWGGEAATRRKAPEDTEDGSD